MNDRTLIALLCGAVVGGAILLLIIAIRGTEPRQATPSLFRRGNVQGRKNLIRLGTGLGVGLIVLVVTRWLVLAVALGLLARLRGPGLREVLSALADSAREELDVRRKVAAERRSTRRSVQVVVAITLIMAAGLVLFNPVYMRPYTSFIGQFVLFIVIALYALGLVWLRKLAKIEVPERFLIGGNDKRATRAGDQRMEEVGG